MDSCVAWAARRRSGGAAAGRHRTRPCGSTREGHALGRHRDPGHRHRHADRRADRRGRGARAPARARSGGWGRHGAERLRPGRRGLADDAVGDAGRAVGVGKVRKTLLQLAGDVFEIAPGDLEIANGRIRSQRWCDRRRRDGGDRQARGRDDRRLGLARRQPRRLRRAHVRLPDRAGRGRSRARRGAASSGSSPSTTSVGSSTHSPPRARSRAAFCREWRSPSRKSSSSTRRRACPSTPTSTTTRSRRSPTCRRS